MEEALELARAKDTKERMSGVERLHQLLEASIKSLSSSEVTSLIDVCLDLLKDNNFRVCEGVLQSLDSAAVLSGEHFKLHFNALVPAVERLGDAKQPVRDATRRLFLTLIKMVSPITVEDVKLEVKILKALAGHENVVEFYNAFEDENYAYIVMELCDGGELLDRILAMEEIPRYSWKCILPIPIGIKALKRKSGPESNVWSIGVITFSLLCGCRPFWDKTEDGIFKEVPLCCLCH